MNKLLILCLILMSPNLYSEYRRGCDETKELIVNRLKLERNGFLVINALGKTNQYWDKWYIVKIQTLDRAIVIAERD